MPDDEYIWADYTEEPPPANVIDLTEDFCDALVNAAYHEPVFGLAQLSDRAGLTDDSEWFRLEEPSEIPQWDSLSWHAQTSGSAIGTLVPFLLVQRGLRIGGLGTVGTNLISRRAAVGLSIREAATTGFVADYLTKPASSADAEDFWTERAVNGGSGAANFAALTAGSICLGTAAESALAKRLRIGPALKDPVVNGILSSAPAGLLTAEIDSVRHYGRLANADELALGLYSAGYAGLVLGAQHKITQRTASGEPSQPIESFREPIELLPELSTVGLESAQAKLSTEINTPASSVKDVLPRITLEPESGSNQAQRVNEISSQKAVEQETKSTTPSEPIRSIELAELNDLIKARFKPAGAEQLNALKARSALADEIIALASANHQTTKPLTADQFNALSNLAKSRLEAKALVENLKRNGDRPYDPNEPLSKNEAAALYWLATGWRRDTTESRVTGSDRALIQDLHKIILARGPAADWLIRSINANGSLRSQIDGLPARLQLYKDAIELYETEQKTDQSSKADDVTQKELESLDVLRTVRRSLADELEFTLSKRGMLSTYLARCVHHEFMNQGRHTAQGVLNAYRQLESTSKKQEAESESIPTAKPPLTVEDVQALKFLWENNMLTGSWKLIDSRGAEATWMAQAVVDKGFSISKEPITEETVTALHYAYHLEKARRDGRPPGWLNGEKQAVEAFRLAKQFQFQDAAEIPACMQLLARYAHENPLSLPELAFDGKTFNRLAQYPEAQAATNEELRFMHNHLKALGEAVHGNPFAGVKVSECAKLWELEPSMPAKLAEEAAAMSPVKQFAAAAAWNRAARPETADSMYSLREIHDAATLEATYSEHLAELSTASRTSAIASLRHNGALPRALDAVHPGMSPGAKGALIGALRDHQDAFAILVSIKGTNFENAYKMLNDNQAGMASTSDLPSATTGWAATSRDWKGKAAVGLAATFKGGYADWINLQKKLGRDAHDASYWLPLQPKEDLSGLAKVLLDNAGKQPRDLEMVANRWSSIPEEIRIQSMDSIANWLRANQYPHHKDSRFAAECGKWGIQPSQYSNYEKRYLASKDVPVPFPVDKKFEGEALTGKFLHRDDPRGLFLGQHTNCCQHPEGAGKSCAWYGQENPKSGFFVVEDSKGEIVAQSWVWISDCNAVVFDNCEAKGLGTRAEAVRGIYEKAAADLATRHRLVTLGHSMGGLDIGTWQRAGKETVPLPDAYSGHTDAEAQVILARGKVDSNGKAGTNQTESFKIRGALHTDVQELRSIAKERYPEGWQFIPFEQDSQGLVIENANKEITGYVIYEAESRYISDIAVKSGTTNDQTFSLLRQLGEAMRRNEGTWSADCRDSTSYRLLKLYERRGYIEIVSESLLTQKMGNEDMHRVTFNLSASAPLSQ